MKHEPTPKHIFQKMNILLETIRGRVTFLINTGRGGRAWAMVNTMQHLLDGDGRELGGSMRKTISIECRIDGTPEQYAAMIDFMRTHAQTILAGAQLIVGGVDKGLAVSFMTEDLYEGVTTLPIDSGSDSDSGETNCIVP